MKKQGCLFNGPAGRCWRDSLPFATCKISTPWRQWQQLLWLMGMNSHLHYSGRRLLSHVVNGILVSEPIGSLHCVIEMPPPVIILHVSQSCIDPTLLARPTFDKSAIIPRRPQPITVTCEAGTMAKMYLCSHSVRPGREELGDAGSVEASLWQAKSGSESCSSRSYYYGVEFMIHNWVLCRDLKTIKGFVCVSKTCAHSRTGSTSSKENILSGPTLKAKCEKSTTDLNMSG